jgi:hypothetical protein
MPLSSTAETTRVLVIVTTGRQLVHRTLAALGAIFRDKRSQGVQVGLLINYDPSFRGLRPEDFLVSKKISELFDSVEYLGPAELLLARTALCSRFGLSSEEVDILVPGNGYGCRKNLGLLHAVSRGFDCVLFWDDDEYPCVWAGGENGDTWYQTDVLGAHLSAIGSGADVSFGFWSGFVSPVPQDLPTFFSPPLLLALGRALSIATESFTVDSFRDSFKSLQAIENPPGREEIKPYRGGKWISGGNLAISLAALKAGRVPAFFTPPRSRGDDTIFSLRLGKASVWRVPAGIFHDCFELYPEAAMLGGGRVDATVSLADEAALRRFGAALDAWLAYAPLFLKLSIPFELEHNCSEVSKALVEADQILSSECPALLNLIPGVSLARRFQGYLDELPVTALRLERNDAIFRKVLEDMAEVHEEQLNLIGLR